MKALTLTQPWAALVALGAKRFETRSWRTDYRGPLAIHAAKGYPSDCQELVLYEPFHSVLLRNYGHPFDIAPALRAQRGLVLATCRLVDCIRITERFGDALSVQERQFGDYTPGRYAWRLDDIRLLATPVPARGSLGLWEWVS